MNKPLVLKRPVIAIAGSSGKTTTKEMLASILSTRWRIYKSAGNQNNRHAMLRHRRAIRPYHQAVVLEFGMSFPGHLRRQCQIIQPNIAVITMVGSAHIGNCGGLDGLIRAKSEIIRYMNPNGTLFLNADDENSQRLSVRGFKGRVLRIGIVKEADYRAYDIHYTKGGMVFKINLGGKPHEFFIPIYGRHNVYNALFAAAVAHELGFSVQDIKNGLQNYHRPSRRLIIYRPGQRIKIIDDTFNANPHSVIAAVDVLQEIGSDNNIVVLGDMAELGRLSVWGHKTVGRYLVKKRINRLFTFGRRAAIIKEAAIEAGFPRNKAEHFVKRDRLHRRLLTFIKPGTTVLVKGSNAARMNQTVRYLRNRLSVKPGRS